MNVISFSVYTGETFKRLHYQFRMGERTIEETVTALYLAMKENYLKVIAN